jgi:uncharacterized protein (DUF2147 family)
VKTDTLKKTDSLKTDTTKSGFKTDTLKTTGSKTDTTKAPVKKDTLKPNTKDSLRRKENK